MVVSNPEGNELAWLAEAFPGLSHRVVDFYSTAQDDLEFIARHRVVFKPTVILLRGKTVVGRFLRTTGIEQTEQIEAKNSGNNSQENM